MANASASSWPDVSSKCGRWSGWTFQSKYNPGVSLRAGRLTWSLVSRRSVAVEDDLEYGARGSAVFATLPGAGGRGHSQPLR